MNIFKYKHYTMVVAVIVLFVFFIHTPLLTAKERRGATVEVTMTDGSQVKGELLAVKTDALLVYDRDASQGKSINLQQVAQVKLLKKSKFLQGLAIGLGVGLGIGLCQYLYEKAPGEEGMAGLTIVYLTPITSLFGGFLGGFASIPEKFSLTGVSSRSVQQNLERLKRYARERDDEKIAAPNIETNRPRNSRPHLRLLWMPWSQRPSGKIDFYPPNGTFRFTGNAPSKDTDVYPFDPDPDTHLPAAHLRIGRLRLEYEWTPHFSSSLEFIASGKLVSSAFVDFSYYSIDYGRRYISRDLLNIEYSYYSLLLGLNWKPFLPSFIRKHIIELGIAAGPAQAQMNLDSQYSYNLNPPYNKNLTWSYKVHAAYDYFYTENYSLGVFIAYQYLRASFPSATFWNDRLDFLPTDDYLAEHFTRPTEFTLPGRNIQLGGMAYGIRVGLRF